MDKKEYWTLLKKEVYAGYPGPKILIGMLRIRLTQPQKLAIFYIRKMQYHASKTGKLHSFIAQKNHMKLVNLFGMCVAPNAVIGAGLHLPHPTGIVIGSAAVIGENCSIYQNVTVGGARIGDAKTKKQPKIGDNVTLFAGSMVLGAVHVADGVTLGANSVLLHDADCSGVYVGSPARRITD